MPRALLHFARLQVSIFISVAITFYDRHLSHPYLINLLLHRFAIRTPVAYHGINENA